MLNTLLTKWMVSDKPDRADDSTAGGLLLEEFATREKKRIGSAINHHCGQEVIHSAALHK